MTEHEKFKWINDTIGYELDEDIFEDGGIYLWNIGTKGSSSCIVDVREIIYTTEFKEKFDNYCKSQKELCVYTMNGVLEHLDDPVFYLYNLLGGQTHENK